MPKTKTDPQHMLYYGDCVALMQRLIRPEYVDLVYLDPPWRPDRDLNVLHHGSKASVEAFDQTWRWVDSTEILYHDLMEAGGAIAAALNGFRCFYEQDRSTFAYLVRMAQVLAEVHRVMKPGASLYLHCDAVLNAPLRMLADAVFPDGFQREIIRAYHGRPSDKEHYRRSHETLYYYSKGESAKTFHVEFEPPAGSTIRRTKGKKQHLKRGSKTKDVQKDKEAEPTLRDVWDRGVGIMAAATPEFMPGFKTQKPLELLHRIIRISSNPGDLVLDPFCGSGPALYASHLLGRRSICMDITHVAIDRIKERLAACADYKGINYGVDGDPIDVAGARRLADYDPDEFQDWCGRRLGASGVHKRGRDRGIDDRIRFRDGNVVHQVIVSVKGSAKSKPDHVRELFGTITGKTAAIGVLVAFNRTPDMEETAVEAGFWRDAANKKYRRIQIITVEELVAKPPRGIRMPTTTLPSDVSQNQRYHDLSVQPELFDSGP